MIRATLLVFAGIGAVIIGAGPIAHAQSPYENCSAAAEDDVYNISSDSPYYGEWLDSDGDGIGCEKN